MKKIFFVVVCVFFLSGCFVLRKRVKYGCPTNGKNIGAERILSGDRAAIKAAKRARRFKY